LIFWYEAANTAYGMALNRHSEGKPFLWLLRGMLSSICSNVLVICFFPLGFIKTLWMPDCKTKKAGPAIVMIHGIYHNASAWTYYRWRLKRNGYGQVYAFSFTSWKTSFEEVYEKLEAWMKKVERECSGKEMVMVGHSLGGLLAKTYAGSRDSVQPSPIRRVITLGTPFMGSKMAALGFGSLSKSLQYQGPLVGEMAKCHPSTQLPCVAFYSPVDNMVLPPDSLLPPAEWKQERTVPLGHTAVLYHGPTFERVLSYIK
jgi:triacylglycerol lipase